jgi:hypothetical protein
MTNIINFPLRRARINRVTDREIKKCSLKIATFIGVSDQFDVDKNQKSIEKMLTNLVKQIRTIEEEK